jgi:hypothetical protein
MINFNDDGQWEQQQDDQIEFLGNEKDFEIVIDDENIEPNWDILIEKFEDEEFLMEEIQNNLEKF